MTEPVRDPSIARWRFGEQFGLCAGAIAFGASAAHRVARWGRAAVTRAKCNNNFSVSTLWRLLCVGRKEDLEPQRHRVVTESHRRAFCDYSVSSVPLWFKTLDCLRRPRWVW